MSVREISCNKKNLIRSADDASISCKTLGKACSSLQTFESERNETKYSLQWTIRDFICETAEELNDFPSIEFEFKFDTDMLFKGELSICGDDCKSRQILLELENLNGENWSVWCICKLNETAFKKVCLSYDTKEISFDLYTNRDHCLLEADVNIVTCEIVYVNFKLVAQPALFEAEKSSLQTDMAQLLESHIMSDVTFEVAGQKISAHKNILASRSKVFANMFLFKEHDMQAAESPNIIISDTEPVVFEQILRYIYTEKVEKLNQMPSRLLIAGDRYGLQGLKLMCEAELVHQINVETASELLILADENEANRLKQHVVAFIKKNSKAVANTAGWKNIAENHLHLLAELYSQIIA